MKRALRIRAGDRGQGLSGTSHRRKLENAFASRNSDPSVTWPFVSANGRNPATGAVFAHRPIASVMVLAEQCTRSPGITQGDDSSGDNGERHGPETSENEVTASVTARGPKLKASRKVASGRKGKRPEKRRGEGELSKLPDAPLDILYEVSPRINPVTDDGVLDDVSGFSRYSLLSTRWTYYGCHGPTKLFVMFSRRNPRDTCG